MSYSKDIYLGIHEKNSTVMLTFSILVMLTFPAVPLYFGLASSFALGTSIVGCGLIFISILRPIKGQSNVIFGKLSVGASIATLILFFLSHLIVAAILGETDLPRAITSLAPLVIIFLAASSISRVMSQVANADLHKAIRRVFLLMCGIAAIAVVGFTVSGVNASSKAVFPFTEPSHFALSFIPLLIYFCVTGQMWSRSMAIAAGLACALLLENLTLIIGCLLVFIVILRAKTVLVMGLAFAILISFLDIFYYVDRLNFSGDSQNISVLVYKQGWQMMIESWLKSNGWGLGFQQLGVSESNTPASFLIFLIANKNLNQTDGSFVLSKLISEFGVFGILMSVVFLVSATRAFLHLRKVAFVTNQDYVQVTFLQCFIFGYLIEFIVRGVGYFTPTTLAMLSSIIILHRMRKS